MERIHKNKICRSTFDCGALPVQLPGVAKTLWFVVMKKHHGSYCWLLCHFKDCPSAQAAVELAIKGYGLRWKIEEVHRQIKVDYHQEAIRLERYEALKTMNALLWMAVSFLYTRLESLAPKIIALPELALVNRKNPKDLWRFKFYKLAAAVKRIVAVARLYGTIVFPKATPPIFLPLTDVALVTPTRA